MEANEQTEFTKELTLGQLTIKKGQQRMNLIPDKGVAPGRAIRNSKHDNVYYINSDFYDLLVKNTDNQELMRLLKQLIIL